MISNCTIVSDADYIDNAQYYFIYPLTLTFEFVMRNIAPYLELFKRDENDTKKRLWNG